MIDAISIDSVRSKLEQQKRRFDNDEVQECDYLESPSWPYVMSISEKIQRLKDSGAYAEFTRNAEATREATNLKRNGDLSSANQKYMDIVRNGTKLTKDHIWPWCKVLMLAKNFDDLKFLVEYLYSYNACYNRMCKEKGYTEVLEAYRSYGNQPPMDYKCNVAVYFRNLCESALASKDEIEWRFAQFGGSEKWKDYKLTDDEFNSFKRNFGMPRPKNASATQTTTGSASNTSSSSSGGCYVATCVYGSYDCPEVWTLRRYRDDVLARNPIGRAFIKSYYAISPRVVNAFGAETSFRKLNKRILDTIVAKLRNRGFEDTPYVDADYRNI